MAAAGVRLSVGSKLKRYILFHFLVSLKARERELANLDGKARAVEMLHSIRCSNETRRGGRRVDGCDHVRLGGRRVDNCNHGYSSSEGR